MYTFRLQKQHARTDAANHLHQNNGGVSSSDASGCAGDCLGEQTTIAGAPASQSIVQGSGFGHYGKRDGGEWPRGTRHCRFLACRAERRGHSIRPRLREGRAVRRADHHHTSIDAGEHFDANHYGSVGSMTHTALAQAWSLPLQRTSRSPGASEPFSDTGSGTTYTVNVTAVRVAHRGTRHCRSLACRASSRDVQSVRLREGTGSSTLTITTLTSTPVSTSTLTITGDLGALTPRRPQ